MSVSNAQGSGDTDGLDEWGWDPFVDSFLRALVRKAPRGVFGTVPDFAWVSRRFLETLDPTEDQIVAALQRFNPSALEERWLYLQQIPETDVFSEEDCSEEEEEDEGEASGLHTATQVSLDEAVCSAGVAAEGSGACAVPAGEAAAAPVPAPARGRVLDAMQSFLFGSTQPHVHAARGAALPAREAQGRCPDQRPLAMPLHLHAEGGAAEMLSNDPGGDAACSDGGLPPVAVAPCMGPETAPAAAQEDAITLLATAVAPARGGNRNEALRRCIDELRWHGEALRRCAEGEDAAELCAEAQARRKALLWSLGAEAGPP